MRQRKPGQVSLERALSKLGIASRTQAHDWIRAGKVKINGTLRTDPAFPVTPETARIEIDGKTEPGRAFEAILLHKTKGTVTTRVDEKGRPTVFSLLPESAGLHAVGRLDLATTGLLILTNNSRFSSWLTDPQQAIPRVYVVEVRGLLTEATVERLENGKLLRDEDGNESLYRAEKVRILKTSGKESRAEIELREGKNREIRKLFLSEGHEVIRLKRISYGGLVLGSLAPGAHRRLTLEELQAAFPGAPLPTDASQLTPARRKR